MSTYIKHHSNKGRFLWAGVLLAVCGGVVGYFYLHPESLPEWVAETPIGRDLQTTTVYKWRDASGAWQVSDKPPPAGTRYQVEKYRRDTNVLPLPPELQR
ncbi:MAG: DUF4124 domain-containing protein [Gammaproteobacteria bacterium]|nr:DUF4124 domain-containing protein [Gammaproteobacteria bacterium]